jgi:iron complex outermembrane receptor protein
MMLENIRSLFLTALFFHSLLSGSIHGESNDSSIPTLSEVVVNARSSSLTSPDSSSLAEKLNSISGGTNLIQGDDLRETRSTTVQETLGFQPGILAQSRFGAEESRLSIRGSGIQRVFQGRGIRVMQDGSPVDSTDGSFDFQSVEPLAAENIAVYRGGNALEIGNSTLGGAIDYQSQTGSLASPCQMRLSTGSFGFKRGQVSTGKVIENQDYYLSLSHYSEDGYREHTTQKSNRVLGNWGTRISSHTENRFYVTAIESQSEIAAPLLKSEAESNPQQGGLSTVQNDHRRDFNLLRLSDRIIYQEDDHRVEALLFYSYRDLDQPIFQVIDKISNDFGTSLRFEEKGNWGSLPHRTFGGTNINGGFTQDHRFVNLNGNRGTRLADAQLQTINNEIFLFHEIEALPSFFLTIGAQNAFAYRGYEDHWKIDGDDSSQQFFKSVSPRFAIRHEFTDQIQVFGNYTRGFKPPTFQELTSSAAGPSRIQFLQDQTADTLELGTRGKINDWSWEGVFYHSWIQNELLTTTISPTVTRTRNAENTIHQGIELGFGRSLKLGEISESLGDFESTLRGVYNWNHYYFEDDSLFGTNVIAGTPEHTFRTECRLEYQKNYYIAPGIEWNIDSYPVDHMNTLYADPYALLSVKAGYRSPHGYHLFVEGKNLLDSKWTSATSVTDNATLNANRQAMFYPGSGIAFYAGIEYQW